MIRFRIGKFRGINDPKLVYRNSDPDVSFECIELHIVYWMSEDGVYPRIAHPNLFLCLRVSSLRRRFPTLECRSGPL